MGAYRLDRWLGSGGFGEVWLARHQHLSGRLAAIKLPLDSDAASQLQRDGALQAKLRSAAVVPVLDMAVEAEPPYLVYRYLPGGTLEDRIASGPLPVSDALAIAARIAHAVADAHGEGILHLDLKPANVLFDASGAALVTDFGLAARLDEGVEGSLIASRPVVGTPAYMSPEQRRGVSPDPRADVFACGVILYEMLTGRLPDGIGVPSQAKAGLPHAVDRLYVRCCGALDQRLRDGASLAAAIRWALADTRPSSVAPIVWRERSPVPDERPRSRAIRFVERRHGETCFDVPGHVYQGSG
ncbi:serine/threonine-protein kinase [Planctomycetota bacterium]